MKKSLIALAVAAALPATAMSASQVRLYGIADAFVGFQDDDRAGGDGGMVVGSGGQSTSRLGFDGSEDLGGGLSAVFKLEGALGMDVGTSGGLTFQRNSYVGLKGGFGTVKIGRTYSPVFWSLIENDVGGMAHSINDFPTGAEGRWDNGIHYDGKFGGLKIYAAYAAGENNSPDDAVGVSARFSLGGFGIGLGYQDNFGDAITQFGVNGAFGGFKLGVNYLDSDSRADPEIGVSASVKIGGSGSILLNVVDDGADTAFQLFYRQGLSKRTNWYAGYLDFDSGGTEFRVGLRHRF